MENYESIKTKILKLRELALRGEHEEAKNALDELLNDEISIIIITQKIAI